MSPCVSGVDLPLPEGLRESVRVLSNGGHDEKIDHIIGHGLLVESIRSQSNRSGKASDWQGDSLP